VLDVLFSSDRRGLTDRNWEKPPERWSGPLVAVVIHGAKAGIELFRQNEPEKMSEKRTTVVSDQDLEEMEGHTDWEGVQDKTDEEIEQAVREDSDAVLLDKEWSETEKLVA